MVFVDGPVVVYKYYIKVCPQGSVLERIVEDDQVCGSDLLTGALSGPFFCFELFRVAQNVAALDPVPVHGHSDSGELLLYLERLVTELFDGAFPFDDPETS